MKELNRNELLKVTGGEGGQGSIGDCFMDGSIQGLRSESLG